jgi:hypothetical protein
MIKLQERNLGNLKFFKNNLKLFKPYRLDFKMHQSMTSLVL